MRSALNSGDPAEVHGMCLSMKNLETPSFNLFIRTCHSTASVSILTQFTHTCLVQHPFKYYLSNFVSCHAWPLSLRFSTQNHVLIFHLPHHTTFYLVVSVFTVVGEEYKLWGFAVCNFIYFLLLPNIMFIFFFPNSYRNTFLRNKDIFQDFYFQFS